MMQVLSYKSNKANPCINFYKINYFYSISKKKLPHNIFATLANGNSDKKR